MQFHVVDVVPTGLDVGPEDFIEPPQILLVVNAVEHAIQHAVQFLPAIRAVGHNASPCCWRTLESLLMQSNSSRRIRPSDFETALGERFMVAAIAWTSIASAYRRRMRSRSPALEPVHAVDERPAVKLVEVFNLADGHLGQLVEHVGIEQSGRPGAAFAVFQHFVSRNAAGPGEEVRPRLILVEFAATTPDSSLAARLPRQRRRAAASWYRDRAAADGPNKGP